MRDVNSDLWLYQGLKVYKNDGYKLDSFLISNPNDTLNLCYQEKIKNAFTGDRFLTSLTQDLNNEVFLSQKSYLDNKSQYVLHLDLDNCQNILPSTIIDNSVKDRAGTTWYLTVPRKVSSFNYTVGDSVNLYQYVGDKLVLKHEYKDKSKPLSKLHVVDDFGNVWASYYYDYTPVYGQWGNQISSKWKNKLIKFDGIKWIDYGAIVYGDYECFQGKNNDIWVVKDSLILKFDGVNWSTYLYPEGLRTPLIRMDKNGTVWCFDSEEHNNMIYEFNGLSWVAHQVGKELEGLIVDPVRGGFWVLNLDKTFSYSRNAQDWIHYEYQYDSLLLNVLIDYKGRIWFESEITIDRFDPENSVLGLEDSKSNSALTNLYFPNPVQNNLNLTNFKGENSIEIYSNTGVFLEKYFNSQSINLQHLNKGLYTIKITDSGSVQTDKFYKE